MIKDLHEPNLQITVSFTQCTIAVFYSPSEDLSLLDFMQLYEEFLKIKANYETFEKASRPR